MQTDKHLWTDQHIGTTLQPTSDTQDSHSLFTLAAITCLVILFTRLITLPSIDLIDSTEGRYAAAAVTMVEKSDYLTPWIDMGKGPEPYLGKPPMHFWITIGAFKVFGTSAFSARIPSFLATVLTSCMIFVFARRAWGAKEGLISALVFLSSGLTFFLAGAAVLDTTLMMFDTAAILLFGGYYLCGLNSRPKYTSIMIGASLSGAFLTKGPVGLAIFIAAVIPWAVIHRKEVLSKEFPLLTCIVTFLVLTIPWYIVCEMYHPGFLYYFIVKENLLRIVSDNYGDRYGTGHPQMFGMSFFHAFVSFMPWSLVLLTVGISKIKNRATAIRSVLLPSSLQKLNSASLLVGVWSLSMPTFLLFTSQYTANYLAPVMPGLAMLLGYTLVKSSTMSPSEKPRLFITLIPFAAVSVVIILLIVGVVLSANWWTIPVGGAIAGAVFYCARLLRSATFVKSIALGAAIITLLYTSAIISLASYISSRRSTGEIFALLRQDGNLKRDISIDVGFFGQPPFSSTVYSAVSHPHVKLHVVSGFNDATNSQLEYFIASKKMSESLSPADPIVEVGRTRKWVLFRRKSLS